MSRCKTSSIPYSTHPFQGRKLGGDSMECRGVDEQKWGEWEVIWQKKVRKWGRKEKREKRKSGEAKRGKDWRRERIGSEKGEGKKVKAGAIR